MRFLPFTIAIRKTPKPLPHEVSTALSRVDDVVMNMDTRLVDMDTRLAAVEANIKETRSRLETIYRKVYRDIEKDTELAEVVRPPVRRIRPGDVLEGF